MNSRSVCRWEKAAGLFQSLTLVPKAALEPRRLPYPAQGPGLGVLAATPSYEYKRTPIWQGRSLG